MYIIVINDMRWYSCYQQIHNTLKKLYKSFFIVSTVNHIF